MKLSTDRILTTHVGSLPRPQPLVELLIKKDRGEPYDAAEFARQVRQAVADIVARQVAIGIDVVSDGESSKVGYATYIKDRLTGFGGEPLRAEAQPRCGGLSGLSPTPGAVRRAATDPPPVLHRTDHATGP